LRATLHRRQIKAARYYFHNDFSKSFALESRVKSIEESENIMELISRAMKEEESRKKSC
jgi:hypothetical protein